MTKAFFSFCVAGILIAVPLMGDWNPSDVVENRDQLAILKTEHIQNLETEIFESVKNSWCQQEKAKLLFELIVLTQPQVCVEIGAFLGSSTLPMLYGLRYNQSGMAYIVEPWSNDAAICGLPTNDVNTQWWQSLDMEAIKNHFYHIINHYCVSSYCHVMRMKSEEAVNELPIIDFLQLDGNFSESGALLDSHLYLPKVKSGGYILISNVLVMINEKPTKMKSLWPLFSECELISELENGNVLLFRKN
jgi:hypothetical protein